MVIIKHITLLNRTKAARTTKDIQYLVIHYVGAESTAERNVTHFANNAVGASAHYFVDAKGVYQSVEEKDIAWHCGTKGTYKHPTCRNTNSIGIEMCCKKSQDGSWYFDKETLNNTIELGKMIAKRYQIKPENVLRHYDVTGKNCPEPLVKAPVDWGELKNKIVKQPTEAELIKKFKQVIQEHCKFNDPNLVWYLNDKHKFAIEFYRRWADSYGTTDINRD